MNKELFESFYGHLSNCIDIDNLIIKGHILSEHALNFYIETTSIEQLDKDSKLSYATKIEVAQVLGLFKVNKEIKKDLKLLNKLRNSIAHNLNYDEKVFDELLKSLSKLKTLPVGDMENDAIVYVKSNEPPVFQKIDNKFVQLSGAKKLSGRHLKFMSLISFICGLIFSIAESKAEKLKRPLNNNA